MIHDSTDLGASEAELRREPTEEEVEHLLADAVAEGESAESPGGVEAGDERETPASREKRYRRALRHAESERDELRDRLTTVQKAEIERLAAGDLADPGDLWADHQITDLLDADGNIDAEAVSAAVASTVRAHPHWRAPQPRFPQGYRGRGEPARGTTWSDVLNPQ